MKINNFCLHVYDFGTDGYQRYPSKSRIHTLQKWCIKFGDCSCLQKFLNTMIHDILTEAANFLEASPERRQCFEPLIEFCKKQLGVTKREIKNLNGLSKTRSVERYQAYDTIYLLRSYRSLFIYLFYFLLSIQVSPQLWIQFNGNLT